VLDGGGPLPRQSLAQTPLAPVQWKLLSIRPRFEHPTLCRLGAWSISFGAGLCPANHQLVMYQPEKHHLLGIFRAASLSTCNILAFLSYQTAGI